jgi:hypothetical protein
MVRGVAVVVATVVVATVVVAGAPTAASAQDFPAITDRDFAIDLYNGNALGSLQMVGMGGAAVALVQGSAGMSVNPAAVGVRSPTSTSDWDWDVHFDWLNPGLGVDRDNNGIDDAAADDESLTFSPLFYVGGALMYKRFSLGVAVTSSAITTEIEGADEIVELEQGLTQFQAHLAASLWRNQIVVGAGIRTGRFAIDNLSAPIDDQALFSITTTSVETGGVWMPADHDLRVGAALTLPAGSTRADPNPGCDPNDCFGLILPERIEVPWAVTAGIGMRFLAEQRWNRKVPGKKWVDERYLLVAADAVITGSVPDGHGVEAFSRNQLQISGDRTAVSVRAGAEYEWLPGRLRIRGGSYYEPSRFRDPTGDRVSGRPHLTAGLDVRFWQFQLWRWRYRLRASLLFDVAERYANGGVSVGFWR